MRLSDRIGLVSVVGLVTAIGFTGCVPFVCSGVGWSNTLTVHLDGNTSAVARVQLCTDEECGPSEEIDPDGNLGSITLADRAGDTWTFSTGMAPLERITVITLEADGTILSETEIAPKWERSDGGGQCGGPRVASVTVEVWPPK